MYRILIVLVSAITASLAASNDAAECGKMSPVENTGLPWAAAIYNKTTPYKVTCGGTLLKTTVVLSAATCFWDDKRNILVKESYGVALGDVLSTWTEVNNNMQLSEIKDIHVPPSSYIYHSQYYEDDIAVVVLQTAVASRPNIRPACLSFDAQLQKQLVDGSIGTFGGWDLTAVGDGKPLKVEKIPYIDFDHCLRAAQWSLRNYMFPDKFCAGYFNGTKIGKGDIGGGLTFPLRDGNGVRYYLRGIASVGPFTHSSIASAGVLLFTDVINHEVFIKKYL